MPAPGNGYHREADRTEATEATPEKGEADMYPYRSDIDAIPRKYRDFRFNGGSLSLDLIATVYQWNELCIDRLSTPDSWDRWVSRAGLPLPATQITDAGLAEMRRLRAAVHQTVTSFLSERAAGSEALDTLNFFASGELPRIQMVQSGTGFAATMTIEEHHGHLLTQIAQEFIGLVTGSRSSRLRQCADPGCPTIFVDKSPSGKKMWCSQQCGARAATRNYRSRHRETGDGEAQDRRSSIASA